MQVALRPLAEDDLDTLVAMLREPSVARWWGPPRDDDALRADLRGDGEDEAFAVLVDGAVAGWLDSWEEDEPHFRHGGLDISLREAHQGKGIGRSALRLGAERLFERGHHRITIDPAAANDRAIRCYEAVGFRAVGLMRAYTLAPDGTWEDGLLMDLLRGELR